MIDDTAFKPFVPPEPMFEEDKPADPPAADKPAKPKRERKPRAAAKKPKPAKAAIPPAPKHVRPTRKKTKAKKKCTVIKPGPVAQVAAAVERGRKRKAKQPRALKLDMASAMDISVTLKTTDFKIFLSVVETLQAVNKATRRRVLAAIGKVFG